LPAEDEVLAAALERLLQHLGIASGEIGRRQHIEHLPHRKLDDRLIPRRYAPHPGGRVVPPLLSQQKRLGEEVERRAFPLRRGKAPILRRRLDQGPWPLTGREIMKHSLGQLPRVPQAVLDDFHLPLRRRRQMRSPVDKGERQRDRRYAAGQARRRRMKRAVALICLRLLPLSGFRRRLRVRLGRDDGLAAFVIARDMRGTR
jgi:hypothetical protein